MNDQTRCSIVLEKLPLYVGDDLDRDGHELVRSHLEECGDCARDAAAAAHSREIFRTHLRRETQERGASAGEFPSHATRSDSSLWDGVRAGLVREGRILSEVTHNARAAEGARPISPDSPELVGATSAPSGAGPEPSGRLLQGRFGSRLAVAAALVLGMFLGPRLLDRVPGAPGAGDAGLPVSPAGEGLASVQPSDEQVLRGAMIPELQLHPLERGLQPILTEDSDLLRDAQPLMYRASQSQGLGDSQLVGYSGGARPRGKLR